MRCICIYIKKKLIVIIITKLAKRGFYQLVKRTFYCRVLSNPLTSFNLLSGNKRFLFYRTSFPLNNTSVQIGPTFFPRPFGLLSRAQSNPIQQQHRKCGEPYLPALCLGYRWVHASFCSANTHAIPHWARRLFWICLQRGGPVRRPFQPLRQRN